jgi:Photosynthetic reaction centre cytochrome C subunit
MSRHLRLSLFVSAALLTLAVAPTLPAQTPTPAPDAAAPQQPRPHRPRPNPTNLKVLPKDYTGDQVVAIMHKFEDQLGVECDYCHAKNPTPTPTTGHLDFASDANPMKDRARVMMRMSHEINQTYLTQLTTPPPTQQVSCGTCHRGNAKPPAFVPAPDNDHPQPAPAPKP